MFNKCLFAFLLILASPCMGDAAEPHKQYPGVIHIHSQFSSGDHSIAELVQMGKERGLRYLIVTDHALVVMEYGLFPLRNLLRKREELPSIIQKGPRRYLQEIAKINQAQEEVVVIAGAESAPYYYWTGNPFKGTLTAHDYNKELLTVGINDPDFFSGLPLLHHGPSTRLLLKLLPGLLPLMAAAVLSCLLIRHRRRLGLAFLILSLLLLANARPWRTSRFTPYDGNQGVAPYQDLLTYARKKGVLTFWAHAESTHSTQGRKLGPITLKTNEHTKDLLLINSLTGFSAIYGETTTMENPGREWDALLQEYCNGSRGEPVWSIAGADFKGISRSESLDTYVTVLWAKRLDSRSLITALKNGRSYAIRQTQGRGLRLNQFQLQNPRGEKAGSGETLFATGIPLLSADVSVSDQSSLPVKVRVIKNGKVWHEVEGHTPLKIFKQEDTLSKSKSYYRIEVVGGNGMRLLSNPIFVEKI